METEYGVLKLQVWPELEQELTELFDIKTEIMQAEVEYLPNNIKRLTIKIPRHKSGVIKEFILKSIAGFKKENLN